VLAEGRWTNIRILCEFVDADGLGEVPLDMRQRLHDLLSGVILSACVKDGKAAHCRDAWREATRGRPPASVPEDAKKLGITDVACLAPLNNYRTLRGQKPNGRNLSLYSHSMGAMSCDAFHLAKMLLTQPLMVVVGDIVGGFGAYRDGCEIIGRAASKEKELVVVKGWSHYDLYDKSEPVSQSLAKLIPFYMKHLGSAEAASASAVETREPALASK
jgi:hypothetical protein